MEYFIINTATKGKYKEDFFNWAKENQMYRNINDEPELKTTYNSGMKAVYDGKRESKDITAVVAFDNNNPVALILCINDFQKRPIDFRTWGRKKPFKTFPDVEAVYVGNVMCFVKKKYRKNGIGTEMLKLLEIEKAKLLIANKEKPVSLMFFKAREKATNLILDGGKFSYTVSENNQHLFDNYGSLLYDKKYDSDLSTVKCKYKEEPTLEDVEKVKLKILSVKKLIEKTKTIKTRLVQ